MKRWIALGLMLVSISGLAIAESLVLSDQDKRKLQSVGISPKDKMITELNAQEQTKFASIMKDKPAAEAKSYLVTRNFLRRVAEYNKSLRSKTRLDYKALFSAAELDAVEKIFEFGYCRNMDEQLDALNGMLLYGITPVREMVRPDSR